MKQHYAWDGRSGPTFDTHSFMRGSLVHDALYQLMKLGKLDADTYRDATDYELWKICREDCMRRVWASAVYAAVQRWGESHTEQEALKKLHHSPKKHCGGV